MNPADKDLIVDAAIRRFSHYGYSKTTMAEIAADCAMSVGNLYRFYKNKADIAVAGARYCMTEKAEAGEQAAAQADSGMLKIRAYCLARLRYLHRFVSETPHMFELVELITGKHQDVLQDFEQRSRKALGSMVVRGVEQGDFQCADAGLMAMNIDHATLKYHMPLCMNTALPELETELDQLLDLIESGLRTEARTDT